MRSKAAVRPIRRRRNFSLPMAAKRTIFLPLSPRSNRMWSHESVWSAIDALAVRHGLSPSGLAKRAGLDPTAFNRSKRHGGDGRPRWPSTESIAKVLAATGESLERFVGLA